MLRNFLTSFNHWLTGTSPDARRAPRASEPPVLVFYWDGATPEGRPIRDLSATGAFIVTDERWYQGTMVRLVFRDPRQEEGAHTATVMSRVVRPEPEGAAVQFVFTSPEERAVLDRFLSAIPNLRRPRNATTP